MANNTVKKQTGELSLSRGAKMLLSIVQENEKTLSKWCEDHKLNKQDVLRAAHGLTKRISVDFAFDIQKATNDRIKVEHWKSVS